ncbi:Aliphatic amidase AmiE [Streptococcus salivarius]|uniref:carbon-nitrogen family hydrolase n=1 Tax=Streptococcus salivarius TaxID=1304 RepID=UPI00038AC513|nr:carbon-nitrogen family hydrolase [Streptococcus salivarius]ALR79394.1 Aliphatic amidase AmiE [Streptococcus salivarius]EQC64219.1 Aliphatic amidase amiE [Streptococcus sp. HSISS1]
MKIALVQMDVAHGQPTENKEHVKEMLERALGENPDVIVLPEMWNTGYALDELDGLADKDGLNSQELLSHFARKHAVAIIGGSVAIEKDGKFYNTTYVYNKSGDLINTYSKVHLFGLMAEDKYMSAGSNESVFELDGVIAASVICYDIRFPEWVRTQMAQGAKVLFVVAQWPEPRVQQWEILLKARAVENQAFVVAVNRVGAGPNDIFSGHSMVIDPLGNVVLQTKEHEEGVFTADINLEEVDKVRGQIPVFEDRRTDLYH